jgi:hypothetical protein
MGMAEAASASSDPRSTSSPSGWRYGLIQAGYAEFAFLSSAVN